MKCSKTSVAEDILWSFRSITVILTIAISTRPEIKMGSSADNARSKRTSLTGTTTATSASKINATIASRSKEVRKCLKNKK